MILPCSFSIQCPVQNILQRIPHPRVPGLSRSDWCQIYIDGFNPLSEWLFGPIRWRIHQSLAHDEYSLFRGRTRIYWRQVEGPYPASHFGIISACAVFLHSLRQPRVLLFEFFEKPSWIMLSNCFYDTINSMFFLGVQVQIYGFHFPRLSSKKLASLHRRNSLLLRWLWSRTFGMPLNRNAKFQRPSWHYGIYWQRQLPTTTSFAPTSLTESQTNAGIWFTTCF